MTRGRNTPELPVFQFENGQTATLHRVSPTIAMFLRQSNPPPLPPIDAETGDLNPMHPAYQQQVQLHNERIGNLVLYAMIDYGTDIEIDIEDAERLRLVLNQFGANISDSVSSKAIYICHVVCADENEVTKLVHAIRDHHVTETEVQQIAESFRGDVEGSFDLAMSGPEIAICDPIGHGNSVAPGNDGREPGAGVC